jgi:prepilin-type N-terminal cleavage/methylation domain-containing protein/prepilin-type processing-associated H-X9-DG protein
MRVRRGFTLIELLVVIAIIAILAAILFPVFARAKAMAKSAATVSNLKQTALAVLQYTDDNGERTPPPEGLATDHWPYMEYLQPRWGFVLWSYSKDGLVFHDAAHGKSPLPIDNTPGVELNWTWYTSLAINHDGLFGWWGSTSYSNWTHIQTRKLYAQIQLVKRSMFITSRWPDDHMWGFYKYLTYLAPQPKSDKSDYSGWWWSNTVYQSSKYHNNGVIVAFGDGHAGRVANGRIFIPETAPWDSYDKEFWGTYWDPLR